MNFLLAWLLKYEGYPPAVVAALLLHATVLYILLPREIEPQEMVRIQPPSIAAVVAKDNPQRLRRIQQLEQQRRADEAAQRARDEARAREQQQARERETQQRAEAERQRQADLERQRQVEAERQRQAEAERQRQAEAERQRLAEAEARRQEEARQQAAREEAARLEAQRQANAAAANAEADLVSQYSAIIHDLIARNWTRPPSARNGMSAIIELRLVPTGEVVESRIIKSSGDAAFDRSAEQAVRRVGGFPELRELPTPVFERNFRNFNLEFRPEDLLR